LGAEHIVKGTECVANCQELEKKKRKENRGEPRFPGPPQGNPSIIGKNRKIVGNKGEKAQNPPEGKSKGKTSQNTAGMGGVGGKRRANQAEGETVFYL